MSVLWVYSDYSEFPQTLEEKSLLMDVGKLDVCCLLMSGEFSKIYLLTALGGLITIRLGSRVCVYP